MKALDKVFDTQVITGIIGINFISLNKEDLYEEGKKTDKKDGGIKVANRYRRKPTEFNKVKVNGTFESCIKLQIIWFNWFENLTGKFWIKTSGNYKF